MDETIKTENVETLDVKEEVKEITELVPVGQAPFTGDELRRGIRAQALDYVCSAVVGIAALALGKAVVAIGKGIGNGVAYLQLKREERKLMKEAQQKESSIESQEGSK